jgi:niacin transporter
MTVSATSRRIYELVLAAVLIAVGIVIPMFSPLRIILEPASFTLASHVAIFLAMFISPPVAAAVAVGTTIGFFLGGFPIVIVARAASHVVFALTGALVLSRRPALLDGVKPMLLFSLLISLLHAVCEVLAVIPFYFGQGLSAGFYNRGFLVSVIVLVGVGTVVHSMVDFAIALAVWKPLQKAVKRPYASR